MGGKSYSDEEIMQAVRKVAEMMGVESLSVVDYERNRDENMPSFGTIRNRMGSWNEVIEKVDLVPSKAGRGMSEARAKKILKVWWRKGREGLCRELGYSGIGNVVKTIVFAKNHIPDWEAFVKEMEESK